MSDKNRRSIWSWLLYGDPVRFRVRQGYESGTDGKPMAWIQIRYIWGQAKDWFPADNRRRKFALDFLEAIEKAEDALEAYDHAKNDNAKALEDVSNFSLRKGIGAWYYGDYCDPEEALPDYTKEFEAARKKWESGFTAGDKRHRRRGVGPTQSEYYRLDGKLPPPVRVTDDDLAAQRGVDHLMPFRDPPQNQKGSSKNRGQNKGGHRNVTIQIPDDKDD